MGAFAGLGEKVGKSWGIERLRGDFLQVSDNLFIHWKGPSTVLDPRCSRELSHDN